MATKKPVKICLVASTFNESIVQKLVDSAANYLHKQRLPKAHLDVVWVPGAFELPVEATRQAKTKQYAAIVALGCIIKGKTPNFQVLSQAVLNGLITASVVTGIPVTCGVITAQTKALALARTKGSLDRGEEAAEAAWQMIHSGVTGRKREKQR